MARLMEYAKQWTGAKSPEVVTSVLATHINVLIYAYSFWCTQPILPFLVTVFPLSPSGVARWCRVSVLNMKRI